MITRSYNYALLSVIILWQNVTFFFYEINALNCTISNKLWVQGGFIFILPGVGY